MNVKVGIVKGVSATEHCQLCGGNTSTGCLAPENQGGSLLSCPIRQNPAIGGR
jgi:hypothetical protein